MSFFQSPLRTSPKGLAWHRATTLGLGILALAASTSPGHAADCPGNPNALGTSRTLVVDPMEHPRIGTMQYSETLPLRDHEVVLTFDDGPLPPHSDQVLQILASECVKATFFIIGRMARQFPAGVRKVYAAGHTIGTHSENHPLHFNKMPPERIRQEIDDGIRHTEEALGNPAALAPFFRVPGLRRGAVMEDYLVSKGLQSWSADFPADDWLPISGDQVYARAIARLEAKGRGILLLHDIQGRTVNALPKILQTLKARGYRIVHVVPATPSRPKTPTDPSQWRLHIQSEHVATARWPTVPYFRFTASETMPAPGLSASELYGGRLGNAGLFAPARGDDPPDADWPSLSASQLAVYAHAHPDQPPALPAPAATIFDRPEKTRLAMNFGVRPIRRAGPPPILASQPPRHPRALPPVAPRRMIPGSHPITQSGLEPAHPMRGR